MPLARWSAEEANRNLRRSRASIWPDGRVDQRLEGIAKLEIQPSFSFTREDRILTVGSCFAREIERRLDQLGFDLLVAGVPGRETANPNAVLNKYTVHSMENELAWAAGRPAPPYEALLLETADGYWSDPHLRENYFPDAPLAEVVARREAVQAVFRRMAECRIVILTLGLAEAWIDHETGLYLNAAPAPAARRRHPGRFSVDCLSHDEILASLERIHAILTEAGHPEFRMLVTVSPVPFKATFSGQDAVVANSYGKSVQRAAAQAFAMAHDNVDYFPSYEIVALSDRTRVYEQDNIHVSPSAVAYIMDTVMAAYAPSLQVAPGAVEAPETRRPDAEPRPTDLLSIARGKVKEGEYETASRLLEGLLERFPQEELRLGLIAPALMTLAGARMGLKDWAGAAASLERLLEITPANPGAQHKLSQVLLKLGRPQDALAAAERAVALNSSEPIYRERLEAIRARVG